MPAGFGRVYVHLPDGFAFDAWMQGLKAGRSFVTTGPMLYATADEHDSGHVFDFESGDDQATPLVERMQTEIERSRDRLPADAIREYETAMRFYASLPVRDDTSAVQRTARPADGQAQGRWLDNMIIDHRFTADEVRLATGLSRAEAQRAIERRATQIASATPATAVRIRPYPGGRHPRIGFLDGAIDPQRETKVSVFPPWEEGGYVVVDVPEAIFSNLGLTYLAHAHIPTIWDRQGVRLPQLEWREDDRGLSIRRELPNGIVFAATVTRHDDGARMRLALTNGTSAPLTGLRVQVCNMLKGAVGFNVQEPLQQVVQPPLMAVRGEVPNRWIITGWQPSNRLWANPPVPCIHADPIFPDCPPGETVTVTGGLWFYEGDDVQAEMQRLRP